MFASLNIFGVDSRLRVRMDQVVSRPERPIARSAGVYDPPCDDHVESSRWLCFNVRALVGRRQGVLLQYGFCRLSGAPVFEGCTKAGGVHPVGYEEQAEDDPSPALDDALLATLLAPTCAGARLIGFHRVLQAGLLPRPLASVAAGFACAWRRHRLHGAPSGGLEPGEATDPLVRACLEADVAPPASPHALSRAQAVARLWCASASPQAPTYQ